MELPLKFSVIFIHLCTFLILNSGTLVHAQTKEETEKIEDAQSAAFEFSSLISSMYFFRGENVFKDDYQWDQHGLFSPSFSLVIPRISLSFTYSSYYQINGGNQSYLTSIGKGHQQSLISIWKWPIRKKSQLETMVGYYFYPFAKEEYTQTINPSYLDMLIGISRQFSSGFFVKVDAAYLLGLQKTLASERYLYLNPVLGKLFNGSSKYSVELSFGGGVRIYNESPKGLRDNTFNMLFNTSVPIDVTGSLSLVPAVSLGWTHLYDTSTGDETAVWFSLGLKKSTLEK